MKSVYGTNRFHSRDATGTQQMPLFELKTLNLNVERPMSLPSPFSLVCFAAFGRTGHPKRDVLVRKQKNTKIGRLTINSLRQTKRYDRTKTIAKPFPQNGPLFQSPIRVFRVFRGSKLLSLHGNFPDKNRFFQNCTIQHQPLATAKTGHLSDFRTLNFRP